MSILPKPILFLLGPSGAGKTQLARWAVEDLRFLHIEIDRWPEGDGIDIVGLREEWTIYLEEQQAGHLATAIRDKIERAQSDGAILSFPGTLVLSTDHLEAAEKCGIRSIILYGTEAECLGAFVEREKQASRGLDVRHWISNNAWSYAQFGRMEFDKYRLMVSENSRHRARGDLVAEIKRRLAD